jgi:hypothetical protein
MNLFKTLFFVFVAILTISSCEVNDVSLVEGNQYETTYLKYTTVNHYEGDTVSVNEFTTKEQLEANYMYGTIEFKAGGIFYSDDKEDGTWVEEGAYVTVTDAGGDTFEVKIEGNILKSNLELTSGSLTSYITTHYTKL